MLPEHVHRVTADGRVYLYWHPYRGTKAAGNRVRIPHEPGTPEFWSFIAMMKGAVASKDEAGTVRGVIAAYRRSPEFKALKEVSRRDYNRYLDEFERRLGDYAARDVTPPVVLTIRSSYGERVSSANHMIAVLRTLFGWATANGLIPSNPAREVRKVSIDAEGSRPWPVDMITLAMTHSRWEVRMFVALAYYTGQRSADVLAMRLSSIIGGKITLTQSKTGKALILPIHRELQPFIDEAKARGSMVLVPGPRGREMTTNQWRSMWTRDIAKAPQSAILAAGLTPHGLRKSAVVALKEAGCTNGEIQAVTGHSLPMIDHYSRGFDQSRQAELAMKKMETRVLQMPAKGS